MCERGKTLEEKESGVGEKGQVANNFERTSRIGRRQWCSLGSDPTCNYYAALIRFYIVTVRRLAFKTSGQFTERLRFRPALVVRPRLSSHLMKRSLGRVAI